MGKDFDSFSFNFLYLERRAEFTGILKNKWKLYCTFVFALLYANVVLVGPMVILERVETFPLCFWLGFSSVIRVKKKFMIKKQNKVLMMGLSVI